MVIFVLFWLSFDCFWRLVHCWYSLGRPVTIGTPMVIFVLFWLSFDCFWRLVHCWYTVVTVLVDMWRLVHQWSFLLFWLSFGCFLLFLTIGTPLVHCWYSLGRPVSKESQNSKNHHWCTNRHMSTKTVPIVYQSSKTVKTVKRQSNSNKQPLVYQSSHVYTESAEYTKPRKRRYLAKPPSHVHGQWPQPVARDQGWLYVSTWTSMCLAPVRCRVLLHSLLPTHDACSSSSLSTTVIKFSIFSDPTRKLSALPPELSRIR